MIDHVEIFEPFYFHMLIKKKWLFPTVETFVELVSTSLSETDIIHRGVLYEQKKDNLRMKFIPSNNR